VKISLYGASGFIGSNYRKISKNKINIIERGDYVPQSEDVLYCVGTTDNYNVFSDATLDIKTNLLHLAETLEAIKESKRAITFNYVSSWFVYGEGKIPYNENQSCNPKGFYSITKYAAELLIKSYCMTFGINYRILRLANVYGHGDLGVSKKKNALQFLINQLKNDETVQLYEGGEIIRDYIHVSDAISGIDLVLEKGQLNEIYNIGTGKSSQLSYLIDIAAKELNSKSKVMAIPTPDFHKQVQVRDSVLDIKKITLLGFVTQKIIEEEIKVLCH
jgi:nucleoside-diphosphate-sugar epimerase